MMRRLSPISMMLWLRHSKLAGASAMRGGLTTLLGTAVSPA